VYFAVKRITISLVKLTFDGLISPNSFLYVLVLSVFLLVQVKIGRYGWRFENYWAPCDTM